MLKRIPEDRIEKYRIRPSTSLSLLFPRPFLPYEEFVSNIELFNYL